MHRTKHGFVPNMVSSVRCDMLRPAEVRSRGSRLLPIGVICQNAAMSVIRMKTLKNRATHIVDTMST